MRTMKTDTINVSGMTCGGCTTKVTRALSSLPGVAKVDVSLASKTAQLMRSPATEFRRCSSRASTALGLRNWGPLLRRRCGNESTRLARV